MPNMRLCSMDKANLLEGLKNFSENLYDIGIVKASVSIENGEILGTFSIDSKTELSCKLVPEHGDYESTKYIDGK